MATTKYDRPQPRLAAADYVDDPDLAFAAPKPARPMRPQPRPSPRHDPEFNAAKQMYAEQYGEAIVSAWYWKLGFLLAIGIAAALLYLNFKTLAVVQNFKPLVVRVDDVGRAEAVKYDAMTYRPEAQTIRYFLSDFCRRYYGRNRFTLQDDFRTALFFMDPPLASSVRAAWEKNDVIKQYLTNQDQADIEVEVKQVAIEQLRTPPYKASVQFDQVYYNPADRSERTRNTYTANFVFNFRDTIPSDVLVVNPIGLAITYFREDVGYKPAPSNDVSSVGARP